MQHWTVQPPPGTPLNARLQPVTLYLPGMPPDYSLTPSAGGSGSLTYSDGTLRRSFSSSQQGMYRTALPDERGRSASLLWVGEFLGTPTAYAELGGHSYADTGSAAPYVGIEFQRRETVAADNVALVFNTGGGAFTSIRTTATVTTGRVVLVGSVSSGAQTIGLHAKDTGVVELARGTSSVAAISYLGTSRFYVGAMFNARNPNAACEMMVLFNRGLSDDECLMLLNNPYAAFAPRRTARIYTFGQPAAGGATAVPVFRHHYVQQGIG